MSRFGGPSHQRNIAARSCVKEQKVDSLFANAPSEVDPSLFTIGARVKKVEDMDYVRDQILATVKQFQEQPADKARLERIGKRLRYQLSLSMDNSDTATITSAR